jgi:hypothetical protein
MNSVFEGTWSAHSTLLPYALSQEYPQLIHVEPVRIFYKHLWALRGLQTRRRGCAGVFHDVSSMPLWTHLWWSKKRRDFSSIHAGLFTANYIREIGITYNAIVRRFQS